MLLAPAAVQIDLQGRQPASRQGDYLLYDIPMSEFDCPAPEGMNQLLWEVKGGVGSNVAMCLDNVRINRGGGGGGDARVGGGVGSAQPASGKR